MFSFRVLCHYNVILHLERSQKILEHKRLIYSHVCTKTDFFKPNSLRLELNTLISAFIFVRFVSAQYYFT